MEAIQHYRPHHTMRELIIDNNMLLMAISRFDIAFGFGDSSVADTCRANGVDTDTFLAVCNLLSDKDYHTFTLSLSSLTGYLKRAHSYFLDFTLPKIRHNLIDAINYSDTDEVAFQLIRFFDDYVKEVTRHMAYENDFIFAYVDRLLAGEMTEDFNIARFSTSHGHMATNSRSLKTYSSTTTSSTTIHVSARCCLTSSRANVISCHISRSRNSYSSLPSRIWRIPCGHA